MLEVFITILVQKTQANIELFIIFTPWGLTQT